MNNENYIASTSQEENQHATLSELILIRDGFETSKQPHLNDCGFCQARLEELCVAAKSLQETLLFSAEMPVPETAWQQLEKQLRERGITEHEDQSQQEHLAFASDTLVQQADLANSHSASKLRSIWSSMNTAIYTLALAIAFTGLVSLYTFNGQQQARVETLELQASIQNLMDNSRGLEKVLRQVADQRVGSPMSVADRSTIDRLQWRLMLVDQKIHESESSDDVSYEQIKALWSDRIDALTQLNELYYANHVAVREGTF